MADNTIPKPHEDEFRMVFQGLITQADVHGVDRSSPEVMAFITHVAELQAQRVAEIRWLRNMLHPKVGE